MLGRRDTIASNITNSSTGIMMEPVVCINANQDRNPINTGSRDNFTKSLPPATSFGAVTRKLTIGCMGGNDIKIHPSSATARNQSPGIAETVVTPSRFK